MTYIEPLISVFLLIGLLGCFGMARSGTRTALVALAILGIFLISWPPAEWLFSRPLESRYSDRPLQPSAAAQAIVVLGGGISPPNSHQPYPRPDRDTIEHCAMAAWLYRQANPLPVLACEGSHRKRNFPSVMRGLLSAAGVPQERVWVEDQSLNTHENAVYGSAILRTHAIQQIILVTDAQSMPRAAACFRKQGLAVTPAPCDFAELDLSSDTLIPNWSAIRRNERTLHEVLGLGWYSLRGWI